MNVDEVNARVDAIRGLLGDPEMAHDEEDRLHRDVLMAISRDEADPTPQALAWRAIKTLRIDFPRWTA